MSLLQFQISMSAFLAAQRTALRSMQLCLPRPLSVGPVQIIIDRIEFGNNAIRHDQPTSFTIYERGGGYEDQYNWLPRSANGYQTQIFQDVTIYVTTLNDILSRPNQPPAITVPIQATLVFDLDFSVSAAFDLTTGPADEDCTIGLRYNRAIPGQLPLLPPNFDPSQIPPPINTDQLYEEVQKALRKAIPSVTRPAGIQKFNSIWGNFLNAGVSVDSQLQRISFRAQIGGEPLAELWSEFFKGNFSDRLGGNDWAFYIDSGLITNWAIVEVSQALNKIDVDNLTTFPGCSYSYADGRAVFTLDVEGVYDLPGHVGTIVRDPSIPMVVSVSEPNTLMLQADYSSVISLIHSFDLVEFFLPTLSNGIEGFMQVQIGSALVDFNEIEDAPYCKKVSSILIECKKMVQMPQVASGISITLTNLLALEGGISLVGTMKSVALTPAAISTSVREFKWQPPKITCGPAGISLVAAFQESTAGFVILHAGAVIDNQGTTPIYLCDWNVVTDSCGAFPRSSIRVNAGPAGIDFSLDIPIPIDEYYQPGPGNYYACDLLVKTTAGTRLLRIGPPPKITQEDINKLAAELLVKIGDCEQQMAPFFRYYHGYNPLWSVDGPVEALVRHLWQVEITGLQVGEMAALVDSENQELVRATAMTGTPMRMSALVAPVAGEINELQVIHGRGAVGGTWIREANSLAYRSPEDESTEDVQGIDVGQQLLVQLGSLSLNEECTSVQATTVFGRRCILAVVRDGIKMYDFSNPTRPALFRSWKIAGVRGALTWQGALLFFGEDGFGWIDGNGVRKQAVAGCQSLPILDAAASSKGLYALTKESLETYSTRLCKANEIAMDGCRSLARAPGKLVVGGRGGLFVYDTINPLYPISGPWLEGIDVRTVIRPLGYDAGTVLASLHDGSARLFYVAGYEIEETASFPESPWFVDSARMGELLLRIGKDRRSLDVSRFGDFQQI